MHSLYIQFVVLGLHMSHSVSAVVTDIPSIYTSWGELSVYADNAEDAFGVQYVGLPDGCQVVSRTLSRALDQDNAQF